MEVYEFRIVTDETLASERAFMLDMMKYSHRVLGVAQLQNDGFGHALPMLDWAVTCIRDDRPIDVPAVMQKLKEGE